MSYRFLRPSAILLLILLTACGNGQGEKKGAKAIEQQQVEDSLETARKKAEMEEARKKKEEEQFRLTEENAVPFFFEYQKEHPEDKVRVYTNKGNFDLDLYEETPYHRANFIYLTRKRYFDGTYFHRVVPKFIIQGGNSDLRSTAVKRGKIGSYLLPPDTRKGFKHHRGTISMPSSDNVNNPHKLASPFEFFIVVTDPGSYHLDGNYTAFGKVTSGMNVVDKINSVPTDDGEWPMQNVVIDSVRILN
ncbi:peptidylprolyl isomerase [Robertkochia marina]|uniref:Peptidyl-prolyl cis-trans isomerase n=1 Tax=Robertkochia marina TaxID=1227945 RepID=A0A4S3M0R5_9FLAO|nr:peptidylprolyl isomerase [Robertkochia marina]THD68022.1 peptidylprolyl isomerase [Robertkochia marina]TRZ42693.1 peptidylprolyl isomerase [Robertkochia marina]